MAAQLGGAVESARVREFGFAQLSISGHSLLLKDIEDHLSPDGHGILDVWMSHGDRVTALPRIYPHRRKRGSANRRHGR